jgi:hypothetical protein
VATCARLVAALPDRVRGLGRRDVRPASDRTAAWGDPPIVLSCGVPRPAALQPETTLLTVNGVDWFSQQLTRGMRFTATGRAAYVQVDVPEDYTEATDALSDLSKAIAVVPLDPSNG